MSMLVIENFGCPLPAKDKLQTGTVELRPKNISGRMSDEEYHNAATVITLFPPIPKEELTIRDMYENAMRSTAFDFLNDPEEDIYTLDDGESI